MKYQTTQYQLRLDSEIMVAILFKLYQKIKKEIIAIHVTELLGEKTDRQIYQNIIQ